jgi:heme/copper-type cytochrome/quinol oxidase subunit 2
MDITNIITNPIVIGLVAGLITWMYLKWRNDKKNKNKKKKEDVNLLIPFAVFIVFWFISYAYFSSCDDISSTSKKQSPNNNIVSSTEKISIVKPAHAMDLSTDSSGADSYELVHKGPGVNIPKGPLPDIYWEMEQ